MKQKKNMVLLGAIFLVLVIIYIALNMWNKNKEEQAAQEAEDTTIHLVEAEELDKICYTDGATTMSFVKEDGTWYYEEDKEIPISQDSIGSIEDIVLNLTATRELENPDELEDYGLTEAQYTLWYTADGEDKENAIYVGSATGDNFYLTINDTEKVYVNTGDLVYAMLFDLSEILDNDDVPSIGSGNLVQVDVTENGKTMTYTEEDDLAQLAGGFGVLDLSDCVNYHVTEEKLEEYGLDEDNRIKAVATYTDSDEGEQTFTVYIGSVVDEENQYVMLEGSKMVYQVSVSVVENMIVVSEEETAEE